MISGIIGILGALTGLVPGILQFFTTKANNAYNLEAKKLEIEAARQNIALQVDLAEANVDAEQQKAIYSYASALTGVKWIDGLAAFIRPYITLIMFHAWVALEALLLLYGIANGVTLTEMAKLLWPEETQAMFSAIIGFWFGDRMLRRAMASTMAVTASPVKTNTPTKVTDAIAKRVESGGMHEARSSNPGGGM